MPATKPTRPLTCHACGSDTVGVAGAQQHRKIRGKRRTVTHARCGVCRNEWWSVHPTALKLGREADKAAKAGAA